ncbi:LPS export ABC transporter permease LptG [Acuticoccus sp. MNP-M23]|uniref:LPS export ABC transporter permease LptG n=1 Tax=Acuticoccus sp. MNP-M23 TaxID=3072793 RepID=UPI002814EAFD|nr:LPS export ABC transporter permease LptG [Acuticoccus sp. MNP-M23]WMS41283.1 LPS export ABC transporter permease LptG [Acuticoccus sp. MNP-M23]
MMRVAPGFTLSRYLALIFLRWIVGFFLLGSAIIFLADAVELIRRSVDRESFSAADAVLASFYKTPSLTEEFLPFAVLFGAIAAFLALNRRLELAVMRAAGVSVWQFIMPGLVVVMLLGVAATTLYNPLSAAARERSEVLSARVLGKETRMLTGGTRSVWFRQEGPSGGSIMHASAASSDGLTLYRVEVHLFDLENRFAGRIEADTATLGNGEWTLYRVTQYDRNGARSDLTSARVETKLTPVEVREAVARPDAISFWQLPNAVELARRAGLPTHRFALQQQVLLARPLLLAAMVLIAASVSLRLVRLGGMARAVTGGVIAGFVLYIASAVASDLGEAGAVGPVYAAWLPGLAAALIGATTLLYTEDG